MLGTNNLSVGDSPCAIIAGLIRVIERVEAIWPSTQIGFLEISPRGQRLPILFMISEHEGRNICGWHGDARDLFGFVGRRRDRTWRKRWRTAAG
jgi:hypothetical protein